MSSRPMYRSEEVRAAWRECRNLRKSEIDGLLARGVPNRALGQDSDGGGLALAAGRVLFEGLRFEFDGLNGVPAIVCPLRDRAGDLADLAAFQPGTGAVATWLGVCAVLGEHNIERARLGLPLMCFETAMDWLAGGREGVAIVDPDRARWTLAGVGRIGVSNTGFGRRLETLLTIRPAIGVARETPARKAAA